MVDVACDVSTTASVPVADSFYEGRIEFPGDCDWVEVRLEAGRRYHFYYNVDKDYDGRNPREIADFTVRGPDGRELDGIRQIFATYLLGFGFTAAETGPHYLSIAAGGSSVGYRLAAGRDCAETKPTGCGLHGPDGARTGTLQSYYDEDVIRVTLVGGETYTFDLSSLGADAPEYLTLSGRRQTFVYGREVPPPEGAASAKRIEGFTAPASGPYFLTVRGGGTLRDGPAAYRVSYRVE